MVNIQEQVERLLLELVLAGNEEFLVHMSVKDSSERKEFERVRDELIKMILNKGASSLLGPKFTGEDADDLEPYERTGFGD